MDLLEPPKVFADKTYKYVLVVIDVVTRYLFTHPLKNKKSSTEADEVPKALKAILRQIQAEKLNRSSSSIVSQNFLLFYSDLGKEFDNSFMTKFLEKNNAVLLTLGDDYKSGMAERVIRSLEAIAANMNYQSETFNFFEKLEDITLNYNVKRHSSLPDKMSPKEYLTYLNSNLDKLPPPWSVLSDKNDEKLKEFDFVENNKLIDKKMSSLQKKLPILSNVKLWTSRRQFAKGELSEQWTTETFYVTGFKRPLLHTEPVLIKISDRAGTELKGVFRDNELKIVPHKGLLTVTDFVDKVKKERQTPAYYIVTIDTFGKTMFFKINNDQLKNFRVTKDALQAKNDLDKRK